MAKSSARRKRSTPKTEREGTLAFNWSAPAPEPMPPLRVVDEPSMRAGVPTLLCPRPGVPMPRLRTAIERRVARGQMKHGDVLRDLADPPKKEPKKKAKKPSKTSKTGEHSNTNDAVQGLENLATPRPIAVVKASRVVVARSRYRGEIIWFDGKAWAVFTDPADAECRYAQALA
jgi:hypothetical protein